jgi:hypothetical protein
MQHTNWEKNGHSSSVHHGYEDCVEHAGVFEMNDVLVFTVEFDVLVNLGLLCLHFSFLGVLFTIFIRLTLEMLQNREDELSSEGHESVDKHGLSDKIACCSVPHVGVIFVLALK